jgi:hypothetical protein
MLARSWGCFRLLGSQASLVRLKRSFKKVKVLDEEPFERIGQIGESFREDHLASRAELLASLPGVRDERAKKQVRPAVRRREAES